MHNSPCCADRQPLVGFGIDDLDFRIGQRGADRGHAQFQRVVRPGHGDPRRRFGLPVHDRNLGAVHALDHAAHHLDRTRRAGHHAGAQRGQVEAREFGMLQLRDEHGGHAVEGGGALAVDGFEGGQRVELRRGQNQRRARDHRHHRADHRAEAVVEGHRRADPVLFRRLQPHPHRHAVVQQVAMASAWRPWARRWCRRCTGC